MVKKLDSHDEGEAKAEPDVSLGYSEWLRHKDLKSGVLYLHSSIREESTSQLLSEIREVKRRQLPELILVISSPGGGAYYAFAIYDALREIAESGIKVKAIVEGWAASAAAMIVLQAADIRIARPHARFLLHEGRRWIFFAVERTSDLEDEIQEMKEVEKQIVKILSSRCSKTETEVENLIKRKEVWMSSSEALAWGLVDKIE